MRDPPAAVGGGVAPAAGHPACAHALPAAGIGQRRASGNVDLSLPGSAAAPQPASSEKTSQKAVQGDSEPDEAQCISRLPMTLACGLTIPPLSSPIVSSRGV
jgi:hypothetical protein